MAHYHVIGIAGAGMSAIAHILLDQGHTVSGCDQQHNALTAELAARGAQIHLGHAAEHLDGVDVVATSSALKPDHPELRAAAERGVPVQKRADLWREWSLAKPTLAIAGTHGKTTTTAMCAIVLQALGYDPAYIVPAGGPVPGLERFARWGSGPFVIEADEYDRLFLGVQPKVAIVTSVDWDHVDIYPERADVEAAFAQFMAQTALSVVACADDAGVRRVLAERPAPGALPATITYGLDEHAEWQAREIHSVGGETRFEIYDQTSAAPRAQVRLAVPGRHNVQNALGAIVGVLELVEDATLEQIGQALASFQGAARRFELKGEAGGVVVVDDYAHNPPKVRAALAAAKMRYPERRLVVYFQPHTYSRTQALIDEFGSVFGAADVVRIGDIYPSRERAADFPGVDAAFLAGRIAQPAAEPSGTIQASADALLALLQPGDVLLTLGAGDGNQVGERVLAALRDRPSA